jgi:RNA polymerase sigma-70 factor (ECF subfamily)
MTQTDSTLQRQLAADLDGTFPRLIDEMQGLVFNAARRWLPARQDAEDVTQEVFIRAYKALADYDSGGIRDLRLRPWLFTITLNLCRNHARTRGRQPRQVELGTRHEAVASDSVEHDAVSSVEVDEWRDRLAGLSARQRNAIVLRHVVGLGYDEISDVVGRPAGTVKSDVHRGLSRLRSMLATEETT